MITALAAAVTTPTARCAAVGVQSTIRTTGEVLLNSTNPLLLNPFQPSDPCRAPGSVPVGYRIPINADGSIGDAVARPGTFSVDLPPSSPDQPGAPPTSRPAPPPPPAASGGGWSSVPNVSGAADRE